MDRRLLKSLLISALFLSSINLVSAQTVAVNNGWNGQYISSIGADGSDYYAQSFRINYTAITKFGVVIRAGSGGGQISLAIASDNEGVPNYAAPLYQGALKNPTSTGGWYYEEGLNIPITPGQKYYVLMDGYNPPGATGWSWIGLSNAGPIAGEGIIWSNSGGVGPWSSMASWPLAIYIEGTPISTIPTMNEWGIIFFMISLAVASIDFLKRFRTA